MIRKKLVSLHAIGVPYSVLSNAAELDRSTVSKYASGKCSLSIQAEERLSTAIHQFQEGVKNAGR